MESHFYTTDLSWSKDRRGIICSPDLKNNLNGCIEIATPPEFPKGIHGIWSPEHLFTAAISSCLMTTFLSVAENSKLAFTGFRCSSRGRLERIEGKYMMSEIILEPILTITDEKDRSKAEKVLRIAESSCLISDSVKSKITVIPTIQLHQ